MKRLLTNFTAPSTPDTLSRLSGTAELAFSRLPRGLIVTLPPQALGAEFDSRRETDLITQFKLYFPSAGTRHGDVDPPSLPYSELLQAGQDVFTGERHPRNVVRGDRTRLQACM